MNKLLNELIDRGLGQLMNESRDALAQTDEIYLNDCKDADLLERQYILHTDYISSKKLDCRALAKCTNECKTVNSGGLQYNELDLTNEQRILIYDHMACNSSVSHRYADISYICGIKDTVGMLAFLGLIKGVEAEK